MGVYFHFRHPKTSKPVTAPKEDNVRRTGTKNARRCGHMALWGCFTICINLVPFHDLWSDGGETENRPPCPQSRTIQSGQSNTSYKIAVRFYITRLPPSVARLPVLRNSLLWTAGCGGWTKLLRRTGAGMATCNSVRL